MYHNKIFWIILLFAAGLIAINGIMTEISLGDESHHYRFAQNIYREGKRVPFDPLYESGNPPGFFYNDPPLWHLILAFLWRITGGISQTITQIYHVFFFILLVWLTSVLAKEKIGEEGRWSSALIITTVPMVVSFSTLLYMDIPMTALSTLSFYLILKRRYIEAGVASGLMFFTKLNAGFFFPGFLFLILWNERRKVWSLLKNLTFFTLPILLIHIPDHYWRKQNIEMNILNFPLVLKRISYFFREKGFIEYLNSYISNPIDLVKYLGLALLFLVFLHLFRFRRWDRKDIIFCIPMISYLISFIILFGLNSDIRYLLPILPFLIVLVTPSYLFLGRKWRFIIMSVCVLQFLSTTYYVHQKRLISPELKEGFEYIRKNVPPNAVILYPEENLLIYGERRMVWSALEARGLLLLFWSTDQKEIDGDIRTRFVDHILIKKSRIYDDREVHHFGGYPKSFVERLPNLDGWVKIFENPGVALWKKVQP
jgi:4-amino-4-deoxy-L-arabinose transferase-like glycosyltransferase